MSTRSTYFTRLLTMVGSVVLCLAASADTEKFAVHKAMDTEHPEHVAISYLTPKGWKATDTIAWNIQDRNTPLSISTVTTSPDGRYIVRWVNAAGFGFSHLGNKGTRGTVPPEHPTDLLIDTFKRGHPGVEVEVADRQETPMPSSFKETATQTKPPRAFICSVKLRYTVNGVPMLTKSGFHYDGYEQGTNPNFTAGQWAIRNITSITGPEADFPKAMKLGAVVLSSRQWDPQFFEQYQEIVMMLVKQIQAEGQAMLNAQFEALRQHFHDLSESNRAAFEQQMAAKDKNTRNFCDYVLDRSRYTDGHTEFILPSGYKRAATNGSDYLVTDDPGYSATGNWRELKKLD